MTFEEMNTLPPGALIRDECYIFLVVESIKTNYSTWASYPVCEMQLPRTDATGPPFLNLDNWRRWDILPNWSEAKRIA